MVVAYWNGKYWQYHSWWTKLRNEELFEFISSDRILPPGNDLKLIEANYDEHEDQVKQLYGGIPTALTIKRDPKEVFIDNLFITIAYSPINQELVMRVTDIIMKYMISIDNYIPFTVTIEGVSLYIKAVRAEQTKELRELLSCRHNNQINSYIANL